MTRWIRRFVALMLAATLLCQAGAAFAESGGKGKGTVEPFKLQVAAFLTGSGADLHLQVISEDPAVAVPATLKSLQVKSYTPDGKHASTINQKDIALTQGKAVVHLPDVKGPYKLEIKAAVKPKDSDEENLEAETIVKVGPDLVVERVQAPAKANANTPIPISVFVREQTAARGAKATVQILNGSEVLDSVPAVQVDPGGMEPVALTVRFAAAGVYNLTVRISGADPAESDVTNNEAKVTIEIATPPATYRMNTYYTFAGEEVHDWEFFRPGASQPHRTTHMDQQWEMLSITLDTADLQARMAEWVTVEMTSETGATKRVTISGINGPGDVYLSEDGSSGAQIIRNPDNTSLYFYTYGGKWTLNARFAEMPSQDYTNEGAEGTILGAKEKITVKFIWGLGAAQSQTTFTLDLAAQPVHNDTSYDNPAENERVHYVMDSLQNKGQATGMPVTAN